ncbi:MAG: ABC transporter permease [Spirochaetales bacterium]|nr:ABC transporter permease [Spirochaetales bacterium]
MLELKPHKNMLENDSILISIKVSSALILAFLFGFIILFLTGHNPVEAYGSLLQGAFGSKWGFGETLISTVPLIFCSLGFILAFRCGLFNMGLEGQIALGGIVAAYLGYSIHGLPPVIHITICIIGAAIAGGLWGYGPGILKARFGIHEVIGTIMMNYIAYDISAYMVSTNGPMKDRLTEMPASPFIQNSAKMVRIWKGTRLHWGIFLAVAMSVVVWFILFRTRLGYKLRAVGKNQFAAEAAGINIPKYITLTMTLSGVFGGLAGGVQILGLHYRLFAAFSPGYGWDAIAVGLLGLLHPYGILAASFLFGVLRSGSILMQAVAGVSKDMISVITGVIIFFLGMTDPVGNFIKNKISRKEYGNVSKDT